MALSVALNAQLPSGGPMSTVVSDALTFTAPLADTAGTMTASVTDGETLTATVADQATT